MFVAGALRRRETTGRRSGRGPRTSPVRLPMSRMLPEQAGLILLGWLADGVHVVGYKERCLQRTAIRLVFLRYAGRHQPLQVVYEGPVIHYSVDGGLSPTKAPVVTIWEAADRQCFAAAVAIDRSHMAFDGGGPVPRSTTFCVFPSPVAPERGVYQRNMHVIGAHVTLLLPSEEDPAQCCFFQCSDAGKWVASYTNCEPLSS